MTGAVRSGAARVCRGIKVLEVAFLPAENHHLQQDPAEPPSSARVGRRHRRIYLDAAARRAPTGTSTRKTRNRDGRAAARGGRPRTGSSGRAPPAETAAVPQEVVLEREGPTLILPRRRLDGSERGRRALDTPDVVQRASGSSSPMICTTPPREVTAKIAEVEAGADVGRVGDGPSALRQPRTSPRVTRAVEHGATIVRGRSRDGAVSRRRCSRDVTPGKPASKENSRTARSPGVPREDAVDEIARERHPVRARSYCTRPTGAALRGADRRKAGVREVVLATC